MPHVVVPGEGPHVSDDTMSSTKEDDGAREAILHIEVPISSECPSSLEELRQEWQAYYDGCCTAAAAKKPTDTTLESSSAETAAAEESSVDAAANDVVAAVAVADAATSATEQPQQQQQPCKKMKIPDSLMCHVDGEITRESSDGVTMIKTGDLVDNNDDTMMMLLSGLFHEIRVHPYTLSTEEAAVEELQPTDGGGDEERTACCDSIPLPHASLQGLWNSLIFEDSVKQDLLNFAHSALLFADRKVSNHIVHWNRLILLHGRPGTGKTSLCKALANKLSIRMGDRYKRATLLEIQSHSLFSKWFSTSGKLVHRVFELVRDMVQDDPDCLVCILIDEIESLAASRSAMSGGNEPTDAMRAVNSLLTSLDRLRSHSNVLLLATTNLTDSVDAAFLDRADMKVFIDLPGRKARYVILQSCLRELVKCGIIIDVPNGVLLPFDTIVHQQACANNNVVVTPSQALLSVATAAEGLSGRSLRRLPLQAHAEARKFDMMSFIETMLRVVEKQTQSSNGARRMGAPPQAVTAAAALPERDDDGAILDEEEEEDATPANKKPRGGRRARSKKSTTSGTTSAREDYAMRVAAAAAAATTMAQENDQHMTPRKRERPGAKPSTGEAQKDMEAMESQEEPAMEEPKENGVTQQQQQEDSTLAETAATAAGVPNDNDTSNQQGRGTGRDEEEEEAIPLQSNEQNPGRPPRKENWPATALLPVLEPSEENRAPLPPDEKKRDGPKGSCKNNNKPNEQPPSSTLNGGMDLDDGSAASAF